MLRSPRIVDWNNLRVRQKTHATILSSISSDRALEAALLQQSLLSTGPREQADVFANSYQIIMTMYK